MKKENILEEVKKRAEAERLILEEIEELATGDVITSELVRKCLRLNERGDGTLYALANRGRFIFNTTSGEMMVWRGHFWAIDKSQAHINAVELVAELYSGEAFRVWEERRKLNEETHGNERKRLADLHKALNKRAFKLRSIRGAESCVKYSRKIPNPLSISGDVFDNKPMLLAVKNGVIDLTTGKFRPGKQEDFISKASPIRWEGIDYPAPLWEKFKKEILDNDKEMIDYVERLLGYSITGSTDEHIFPVLQGRGRNGKGTIVKVLRHVLGPLASVVPSEILLEHRFSKNSSAPSPDIMSLRGLRFAFSSEINERNSFSASAVKLLTGGDELSARNPHDKYQSTFKPSHKLILLTNDKPRCPDSDYAFWCRLRLIEFPFSFVPDPDPKKSFEKKAVKDLYAQLLEEGPGILASLVRDCLRWQKEGLKPPAKVLASTDEYMRDEDILSGFIEQCCIVGPALNASAAQLKDAFEKWFKENIGEKPYSWRWVGLRLKKKFETYNRDGRVWYRGIGLVELSCK